jgi:hypothetical protein
MYKVSTRWAAAIAALVVLFMPATAFPAQNPAPCANVSVSVDPTVANRGDTVTLAAAITNCSSVRQRYIIKYELTTPCTRMILLPIILRFNPGQTLSANVAFRIPRFLCPGDYTLKVSVFSGTALLASSSATLTVN